MKRILFLAACLWPAALYAQEPRTYTNADLVKFAVPGAYTNEDLRRLPPLAVQREAAAPLASLAAPAPEGSVLQPLYDGLRRTRAALQAELEYEIDRVAFSTSALAGESHGFEPRLGYETRVRPLVMELKKRVALLDRQMDEIADEASRAGAPIDRR
jgi:hypothetical protein